MTRPNAACDEPPARLRVGGGVYAVNTDFRVWIDIMRRLGDLRPDASTVGDYAHNLAVAVEVERLAFSGALVDENVYEALNEIAKFLRGYPEPFDGENTPEQPLFSFEHDINYILMAIRNQSGVDLRFGKPLHWWLFLLEFASLSGDHFILRLMEARGYKGADKERLRLKRAVALPVELSREQMRQMALFERELEGDMSSVSGADEALVKLDGREYTLGGLKREIERMRESIRDLEQFADILKMIETGRFPVVRREGS